MARGEPCCSAGGACGNKKGPEVDVLCRASQVIENDAGKPACRIGACAAPAACCANGSAMCRVPLAEAARAVADGAEDGCGDGIVLKCSGSQVRQR